MLHRRAHRAAGAALRRPPGRRPASPGPGGGARSGPPARPRTWGRDGAAEGAAGRPVRPDRLLRGPLLLGRRLLDAANDLAASIAPAGSLVAVHWRRRTRDYPPLGDEVHDRLAEGLGRLAHPVSRSTERGTGSPLGSTGVSHAALVVIGGGPAGLAAARGYRDAGGDGEVLFSARASRTPVPPPAAHQGLPARGARGRGAATGAAPSGSPVDGVRRAWRAVALDPAARWSAHRRGEAVSFEHCVLATGSRPKRPDLPGRRHGVRAVQHPWRTRMSLRAARARAGVVVGSGFIGCEAAVSPGHACGQVELVTDERVPRRPAARRRSGRGHRELAARGGRALRMVARGGDGPRPG